MRIYMLLCQKPKVNVDWVKASVSLPVLGVVAGFLRRQRTGQSGHLDPDSIVQVLLTGVDSAGNYKRHAEQTGPVLLR